MIPCHHQNQARIHFHEFIMNLYSLSFPVPIFHSSSTSSRLHWRSGTNKQPRQTNAIRDVARPNLQKSAVRNPLIYLGGESGERERMPGIIYPVSRLDTFTKLQSARYNIHEVTVAHRGNGWVHRDFALNQFSSPPLISRGHLSILVRHYSTPPSF